MVIKDKQTWKKESSLEVWMKLAPKYAMPQKHLPHSEYDIYISNNAFLYMTAAWMQEGPAANKNIPKKAMELSAMNT